MADKALLIFDIAIPSGSSLNDTLNLIHDKYQDLLGKHPKEDRSTLRKGLIRGIIRAMGREWISNQENQNAVSRELNLVQVLFDAPASPRPARGERNR